MQYTEVKSEKILKKSEDLQGFQRYILKYPHNMNHTMHILVTYYKMTNLFRNNAHQRCKLIDLSGPNNTDYRCPLKRGNTQSALHLVHNIYSRFK